MSASEDFFGKIDYTELRTQKDVLLGTRGMFPEGTIIHENLTGILHLIDAIQDHAVDVLGIPEADVFADEPHCDECGGVNGHAKHCSLHPDNII